LVQKKVLYTSLGQTLTLQGPNKRLLIIGGRRATPAVLSA